MNNALVRLIGWRATVVQGDPCVVDRWRWLKRHLQPGSLRTLDAGCGSGAFTLYAARIGNDALGVSFDEANNRKARERASMLHLPSAQFDQIDLRDLDRYRDQLGHFDQIICFETLEHILNDRKLLADLATMLKPGGRLLLTTPYRDYRPLWGDHVSSHEDGGHVRWGYTHEEVRVLFNDCGLQVVTEDYLSGYVSQQLTNLMRWLRRLGIAGWALVFPLRVLQIVDRPVTSFMHYPFMSIGVVGLKPVVTFLDETAPR